MKAIKRGGLAGSVFWVFCMHTLSKRSVFGFVHPQRAMTACKHAGAAIGIDRSILERHRHYTCGLSGHYSNPLRNLRTLHNRSLDTLDCQSN